MSTSSAAMNRSSDATEHAAASSWIGAPEHVATMTAADRRTHDAMQSTYWGLRSDGTLGVRSGTKEHASRQEGFFTVNDLPEPLPETNAGPSRMILSRRPNAGHAPPVLQHNTTAHAKGLLLDVKVALTGETVFTSLLVDPHEEVRLLLRRLQFHTFKENQAAEGKQIHLMFNDRMLETSMPLVQSMVHDNTAVVLQSMANDAREHIRFELQMVTQPVLLSWKQLTAMPFMRKRAGRGGVGTHMLQKRLRLYCYEHNTREVDLSKSDYDWRLLLRNTPHVLKHFGKSLLAGGVIGVRFCPLDQEDPNYAYGRFAMHANDTGDRHVFEMSCADGHLCHMHFHRRGTCDVVHVPYDGAQPL